VSGSRAVGQHRSTKRRTPRSHTVDDPDRALRKWLRGYAKAHPRWGHRRAHQAARAEGWVVNHKKVQRLWRQEGLCVPVRRRRKRAGCSTNPPVHAPDAPDAVWAIDLQYDSTIDGRPPVVSRGPLTAWSHPGRVRSEAAFASLAGVNPIPASSGNTVRHRINRGRDRRLNRALHMAIVTRMRMDPQTRAYVERRTADGRTLREIRRCLKRYLARQIYRHLNAATPSSPNAA